MAGRRGQWALYTVFLVVMTYSMAFMAQVPLLPYLLQELGSGSSASFGSLQVAFSLSQLVGGLVSGPCLDKWGAKTMLIVSLVSATLNYFFTATAPTLSILFLSRVFAVMQHALLAARTFIAAAAPPDSRVRVLSYMSVFNSAGFALGPALGGALSYWGIRTTAWAATIASVLSIVAVAIIVPGQQRKPARHSRSPEDMEEQTHTHSHTPTHHSHHLHDSDSEESDSSQSKDKARKVSWLQALQVLKYPAVRQLMITNLTYNVATGLVQSIFALLLRRVYGLGTHHNGMVLSYQGALSMAAQAFLVEPLRRAAGEGASVVISCVGLLVSFLLLSVSAGSVPTLMLSLVPSAAATAILSTVLTAQLTRAAPQQVVGSVLALDMSLFAAVRMITPAIATGLLDIGGAPALGTFAALLMACLLVAMNIGWVRSDGGLTAMAAEPVPRPIVLAGPARWSPVKDSTVGAGAGAKLAPPSDPVSPTDSNLSVASSGASIHWDQSPPQYTTAYRPHGMQQQHGQYPQQGGVPMGVQQGGYMAAAAQPPAMSGPPPAAAASAYSGLSNAPNSNSGAVVIGVTPHWARPATQGPLRDALHSGGIALTVRAR